MWKRLPWKKIIQIIGVLAGGAATLDVVDPVAQVATEAISEGPGPGDAGLEGLLVRALLALVALGFYWLRSPKDK